MKTLDIYAHGHDKRKAHDHAIEHAKRVFIKVLNLATLSWKCSAFNDQVIKMHRARATVTLVKR